jgi:hypothetical protein
VNVMQTLAVLPSYVVTGKYFATGVVSCSIPIDLIRSFPSILVVNCTFVNTDSIKFNALFLLVSYESLISKEKRNRFGLHEVLYIPDSDGRCNCYVHCHVPTTRFNFDLEVTRWERNAVPL